MKKVLFVAIALVMVCCITACESSGSGKDNSLVGTWAYSGDSELRITFQSNGNYVLYVYGETETGTWSTSDGNITTKDSDGVTDTSTYSVSGNTLTVDDTTWTKV